MTKYTLTWHGTLIDNENGWHIPQDVHNRHFVEYATWKASGNYPDFELENYELDAESNRYVSTQLSQEKYNLADFPSEIPIL